ncbi:unnamed protein product, partial [Sphacelaria rigidula]
IWEGKTLLIAALREASISKYNCTTRKGGRSVVGRAKAEEGTCWLALWRTQEDSNRAHNRRGVQELTHSIRPWVLQGCECLALLYKNRCTPGYCRCRRVLVVIIPRLLSSN